MLLSKMLAYAPLALWLAACSTQEISPDSELPAPPAEVGVNVAVDATATRSVVAEHAYGMHSSVYDNNLHNSTLPAALQTAGVTLLRYPGGGYSDNYHWSTHKLTAFGYADSQNAMGYLADRSDFGSFVSVLDSFGGTAMITVNYGSNLAGSGPGDPQEAAAWVAYANGATDDTSTIGVDSSGTDWKTVGYWASLRAAAALTVDDGQNFLRISHPAPVGIRYWEIGNELFGNGYYDHGTFEEDLHVPYDGSTRKGDTRLSPTTYGNGVKSYLAAMKAVDPSIQVGAVLNTPPLDFGWGPNWDPDVLAACGQEIDFAIIHWYPSSSVSTLPQVALQQLPGMFTAADSLFAAVGPRATPIQVAVTEMGAAPGLQVPSNQRQVIGLLAAEGYAGMLEHGVFNIDWLELHNGTFLSSRDSHGPAFKGIELVHQLAAPGDTLVTASSSSIVLSAHAATRADGSLAVMLVNTTPSTQADVTLSLAGSFSSVERYDYVNDGNVTGPTPVTDFQLPYATEVAPYAIALLILKP